MLLSTFASFNVPISIISIVDHYRIWFKSHHGLGVKQVDREPGLCASAILRSDPHILIDASKDVRSLANPLAAGDSVYASTRAYRQSTLARRWAS